MQKHLGIELQNLREEWEAKHNEQIKKNNLPSKKYTKKDFADLLEISKNKLTKIERIGTKNNPYANEVKKLTSDELQAYHRECGVSYEWLLGESEEKYPSKISYGELGLTNEALENLKILYEMTKNEKKESLLTHDSLFESYTLKLQFINSILENNDIFDKLFTPILYYLVEKESRYIHCDKKLGITPYDCDSQINKEINRHFANKYFFQALDELEDEFDDIFQLKKENKNDHGK